MTTRIAGYLVELSLYEEDGEPRSDCFISKGKFSASLTVLEGYGYLENHDTGNTHTVDPGVIEEITEWAEENGY